MRAHRDEGDAADVLELAERALAHAGPEAQAAATRERSLVSRFARSRPTQATQVDDTSVAVLCLADGHTGLAETNDIGEHGLRDGAARARAAALAAARAAAGPGEYPGLPQPEPARAHDGFDVATARLDAGTAAAALRASFAACAERELEAFGLFSTGVVETAIATTTGLRARDAVTDAFLKVVARDADGRSGFAAATGRAADELDVAGVARRAVALVPSGAALELAPGELPVVLSADAVGTLLEFLGFLAFNGLTHAEGRGALGMSTAGCRTTPLQMPTSMPSVC